MLVNLRDSVCANSLPVQKGVFMDEPEIEVPCCKCSPIYLLHLKYAERKSDTFRGQINTDSRGFAAVSFSDSLLRVRSFFRTLRVRE